MKAKLRKINAQFDAKKSLWLRYYELIIEFAKQSIKGYHATIAEKL